MARARINVIEMNVVSEGAMADLPFSFLVYPACQ